MQCIRVVSAIFLALVFTGCASTVHFADIEVQTDSDPKVELNGYKSYAWMAGAVMLIDDHGQWVPPGYDATAEFKHQVDRVLREKGLSENNRNPEMLIAFAAGIDMNAPDIQKNAQDKFEIVGTKPQGGLILIFADRRNGQAIWAGVAQGDAQKYSLEESKARIRHVVETMLESFP